jgi:hypothetical protein
MGRGGWSDKKDLGMLHQDLPTHLQVAGWLWSPTAIHSRMRTVRGAGIEEATPRMARPPAWTEGELPCHNNWSLYDNTKNVTEEEAAELCAGCPVIETCLKEALAEEGTAGASSRHLIRGGLLPHQRAALSRPPLPERCRADLHDIAGEGDIYWHRNGSWRCVACTVESRRLPESCGNGHPLSEDAVYRTAHNPAEWECAACKREARMAKRRAVAV